MINNIGPFLEFFGENREILITKSPGRLDVMGGIADYSGSLLLQMPIAETASVAIAAREDQKIRFFSEQAAQEDLLLFELSVPEVVKLSRNTPLKAIRDALSVSQENDWALYPLGCLLVLLENTGFELTGFDLYIASEVPLGKGVSSSASIEVATLMALRSLFKLRPEPFDIPLMAQKAENEVVGAPCGLMDQLTSYFGHAGKLLPIKCQPYETFEPIDLSPGIQFSGIDSGIRHAVSGASYGDVRTAAFMGYTIIALQQGASAKDIQYAQETGDWANLPFKGYLANITVEGFEQGFSKNLPTSIKGNDFLQQYPGIIDTMTKINPGKVYAVHPCTSHPIYENDRIAQFAQTLQSINTLTSQKQVGEKLRLMGKHMLASHESYSKCGLGNEYTDLLVSMAMEKGAENGVFGARVTGGGSGGTVCALHYGENGLSSIKEIAEGYGKTTGKSIKLFNGSAMGGHWQETQVKRT